MNSVDARRAHFFKQMLILSPLHLHAIPTAVSEASHVSHVSHPCSIHIILRLVFTPVRITKCTSLAHRHYSISTYILLFSLLLRPNIHDLH